MFDDAFLQKLRCADKIIQPLEDFVHVVLPRPGHEYSVPFVRDGFVQNSHRHEPGLTCFSWKPQDLALGITNELFELKAARFQTKDLLDEVGWKCGEFEHRILQVQQHVELFGWYGPTGNVKLEPFFGHMMKNALLADVAGLVVQMQYSLSFASVSVQGFTPMK